MKKNAITTNNMDVFEQYESNVRSYCRSFPTVFCYGKGPFLYDEEEKEYLDFFSGAGALNYGHNPDFIKKELLDFISKDFVMHALDMYTTTKRDFLERFVEVILKPRSLDYKVQFCGPTGANAVEAALKVARLNTGRHNVCFFSGGWHGMTTGCLSVTGNKENRQTIGAPLANTTLLPYCCGPSSLSNSMSYFESLLKDPNSGLDLPAAVIVETVQAEGGVYIASIEWLQQLRKLCTQYNIILIIDEVQVGCGRSGSFFSFERADIVPDIVCMAKSIGGYGLPMAINLIRRELDVWKPGQHSGTFRGNQLAFLGGYHALSMWTNSDFSKEIKRKGKLVYDYLIDTVCHVDPRIKVRGLGLILGIDLTDAGGEERAKKVSQICFKNGLIIERCGRDDVVLKLLPPLITSAFTA